MEYAGETAIATEVPRNVHFTCTRHSYIDDVSSLMLKQIMYMLCTETCPMLLGLPRLTGTSCSEQDQTRNYAASLSVP